MTVTSSDVIDDGDTPKSRDIIATISTIHPTPPTSNPFFSSSLFSNLPGSESDYSSDMDSVSSCSSRFCLACRDDNTVGGCKEHGNNATFFIPASSPPSLPTDTQDDGSFASSSFDTVETELEGVDDGRDVNRQCEGRGRGTNSSLDYSSSPNTSKHIVSALRSVSPLKQRQPDAKAAGHYHAPSPTGLVGAIFALDNEDEKTVTFGDTVEMYTLSVSHNSSNSGSNVKDGVGKGGGDGRGGREEGDSFTSSEEESVTSLEGEEGNFVNRLAEI